MRTALAAAIAALTLSGCSVMIDTGSVEPPNEQTQVRAIGACIEAPGGHAVCGGRVSGGASPTLSSSGHAIERGAVGAGAADVGGASSHGIQQGTVSP